MGISGIGLRKRYIDVNEAMTQFCRREHICIPDEDGKIRISTEAFKSFLRNRPEVDVEPVVRCSQCVFSKDSPEGKRCQFWGTKSEDPIIKDMNGFCSGGILCDSISDD